MTPTEALEILTQFNRWRRGEESTMTILNMNPHKIGIAIDVALSALRNVVEESK